ncbi:MAG: sigma-70 family RNA polymerase sigma factor [Clostridium butyricum]|nr:sigma-70 family RNA polymerase sigma factor [Clostridium butyricum]
MRGIFKEKKIESYIIENRNAFYKVAYSYTQNEEDALDIVQESIYKALNSIDSLKEDNKIKSWFYKILIRTSIDFIRKNKKYIYIEAMMEESECDEYKDIDLDNALNKIPTKYKTIIILRYFEDFKIEEIAEMLGENVNTVKSRLYAALKKLKVEMKGDNFDE